MDEHEEPNFQADPRIAYTLVPCDPERPNSVWMASTCRVGSVKVRGQGAQPLCSDLSPCNSMSPLIESIKCYFVPKLGGDWGMGMGFAPTWLRQVTPLAPASHDHFNY